MTLRDILLAKGTDVFRIGSDATLEEAVAHLIEHNCGSLVVVEGRPSDPGAMIGIVTERDILRASTRGPLSAARVRSAMTVDVVIGAPTDSVEDTMGLMTDKRIRHLPILDEGRLIGLISIGDVVKAQHDHLTMENHYLKSYLHG